LQEGPYEGVRSVSAGGTNPVLFTFSLFSFPVIFEKIIPQNLYPDELKEGRGDGLVSADSSRMPWADEHYCFDCNHAGILFDEGARNILVQSIGQMCL
jgi:hypothetical protein